MASQNKKNKEDNCNSNHGFALKESGIKLKRRLYFNSSNRQQNKKVIIINLLED